MSERHTPNQEFIKVTDPKTGEEVSYPRADVTQLDPGPEPPQSKDDVDYIKPEGHLSDRQGIIEGEWSGKRSVGKVFPKKQGES